MVNTAYRPVHPTSDNEPFPNAILWDAGDVRSDAAMVDAVHAGGALAGVELWRAGSMVGNLSTQLCAQALLTGDPAPEGHIVLFDDDHHYLGPVLAIELVRRGHLVIQETRRARACAFGGYVQEKAGTIKQLMEAGVAIVPNRSLETAAASEVRLGCVFAGRQIRLGCDALLRLTRRLPVTDLHDALCALPNVGSRQCIARL